MQRHRFHILLGTLALLLATGPVLPMVPGLSHPFAARVTVTAVFTAVLLSAVLAVARTRLTVIVALALAVPEVILSVLGFVLVGDAVAVATHVLSILLLGYTAAVLIGFLFSAQRVTANMISASLCAYLILGVLWANVFSMIAIVEPDAFHFSFAEDAAAGSMRFGAERTVLPLYFSFVTMTTLGYGDIVPVSSAARMLAATAALVGQFYLAVLVARLVGLHISQSRGSGDGRNRPPRDVC